MRKKKNASIPQEELTTRAPPTLRKPGTRAKLGVRRCHILIAMVKSWRMTQITAATRTTKTGPGVIQTRPHKNGNIVASRNVVCAVASGIVANSPPLAGYNRKRALSTASCHHQPRDPQAACFTIQWPAAAQFTQNS